MSRQRLVSAASVIVGLVILGVWILWPAPLVPPRSAPAGSLEAIDLSRIANATLVRPQSETQAKDLAANLERTVRRAASGLPKEVALTDAQARDLARLVRTRMELLLVPDYKKYRDHVIDLTGHDPLGKASSGLSTTLEDWEYRTSRFKLFPVDTERPEIRCRFHRGRKKYGYSYAPGGHTTTIVDAQGEYSPVGDKPEKSGFDIYVVSVPMEVFENRGGENGKPLVVLYVLSVVWLPDRQRWAPWECGFNDVIGGTTMPIPWL